MRQAQKGPTIVINRGARFDAVRSCLRLGWNSVAVQVCLIGSVRCVFSAVIEWSLQKNHHDGAVSREQNCGQKADDVERPEVIAGK